MLILFADSPEDLEREIELEDGEEDVPTAPQLRAEKRLEVEAA